MSAQQADPASNEVDNANQDQQENDFAEDNEFEDDNLDEDNGGKQDYVKKSFTARPYESPETLAEVENLIVKNSRPLIKLQVTKQRREFGGEFSTFVDREPNDSTTELKYNIKNQPVKHNKTVLEVGLQAGNRMLKTQTQTNYNRSVNASVQYDSKDFVDKLKQFQQEGTGLSEKLDKFIDKVAFRVEEALQSNELIDVFVEDFEILGDEEAETSTKISQVNMTQRTYQEQEYCKNKRVSCIKFHPTKSHLVAMSLIENLKFDDRIEIMGKSFESHVVILNFSDAHLISLNYVLETPVEISCIEFHPKNPNVLIGGCINGQIIVWDLSSVESRITGGRKADVAKMPDEEQDKTQQVAVKLKQLQMSTVERSHKSYVSDIQFIPGAVKVDKKHPGNGESVHFITVSEDGQVLIWDSRVVEKDILKEKPSSIWVPFNNIMLIRQDGGGELGLSKILFTPNQTTPTFWATSDEGDLLMVDWSVKLAQNDDGQRSSEYVKLTLESERNYRPVLALERSGFYEDLILTVHDFHFAIWKTSVIEDHPKPIYCSANTFSSHNTCGAFSPTRPGVIFITKTDGIDVWDFVDQSNKPSLTLNFATSAITTFKFQILQKTNRRAPQIMAYGDESDGTMFLYEVPPNLKNHQENEQTIIQEFWDREFNKCTYVKDRRVQMKEEYVEKQKKEDERKQLEESAREQMEDAEMQKEMTAEEAFQDMKLTTQVKLGLISEEELDVIQKDKKKKKQ